VLSAVPAPDRPDHVQKPISLDKLLRLLESFRTHSMQLRHAMPRPD
jgi:hypothetical protein